MKKKEKEHTQKKSYRYFYIPVIVAFILILLYLLLKEDKPKYTLKIKSLCDTIPEPQFKKDGELSFLSKEKETEIKKIDIEIADNDRTRMIGMMCRRSMDDNKGMFFVFPESAPQSFWMKNTLISLDILFIDEKKEIVKIHKKTIPLSEKSLPSVKNSMYVVEVASGFTDRYGIKEGDKIKFNYN